MAPKCITEMKNYACVNRTAVIDFDITTRHATSAKTRRHDHIAARFQMTYNVTLIIHGTIAVSYTYLDVYKRQLPQSRTQVMRQLSSSVNSTRMSGGPMTGELPLTLPRAPR